MFAYTPEKYLVCRSVRLARTGWQNYKGEEIGLSGDDSIYRVYRPASEVFSKKSIASAEGKALCGPGHPSQMLDSSNTSWFQRGHVQNIRRGGRDEEGNEVLIGDLVVTDPVLAGEILSGRLREISCGYQCKYTQIGEREFMQSAIVINHIAIVPSARAGSTVAIQDSTGGKMNGRELVKKIREIEASVDQALSSEIMRAAETTEDLTREGIGPFAFHERFRRANPAYADFDSTQRSGQAFADEANAMGRKMRGEKCEPTR